MDKIVSYIVYLHIHYICSTRVRASKINSFHDIENATAALTGSSRGDSGRVHWPRASNAESISISWHQHVIDIHGIADNSTPLCKSNGTFLSDMDINELTSVLHKYKTPVTKCCILTCCWVNLVCIRHLIVKIMPEKHLWGPDFLISDSLYIFQLFKN